MSTFVEDQEKENHPELYDKLAVRTKELCNVAEDNGVKLVIEVEPHQLFQNLKSFFDVADKVNSPAFKLNFDIGHMYLSEVDLEKSDRSSQGLYRVFAYRKYGHGRACS